MLSGSDYARWTACRCLTERRWCRCIDQAVQHVRMTASDLIVADVLARLARISPLAVWTWEADAVHQAWIETLAPDVQSRIRATIEARIAAACEPC